MEPKSVSAISPELALLLGSLFLFPSDWIHRRVEQVAYLDESTLQRRISIDFDVPPFDENIAGQPYVPLAQFVKRNLINFSLSEPHGPSLPMITAEGNGYLSSAMLLAMAHHYGDGLIDSVVENYIPHLVRATTEQERDLARGRIFQPNTSVGAQLLSQTPFVAVANDLAFNFVLYLPVTRQEIGMRRIVKISFEAPRPALDVAASGIGARIGWRAAQDRFAVPLAGYCQSYHFELEAPPEMEITAGVFVGGRSPTEVASDSLTAPVVRAHFHLAQLERGPGAVFVSLRARASGLLSGAALFSLVNALVLLFVLWRLSAFSQEKATDAVVSALIVVPGLLVGYIARPTEHQVLTSFLTALRAAAMVSVLTAFAGALVLFAGFSEQALESIYVALACFATGAFVVLAGCWGARQR
jgi:hypothetical protein